MNTTTFRTIALLTFVLCGHGLATAQDNNPEVKKQTDVELRWKFAPGTVYKMEQTQGMVLSVAGGPQNMEVGSDSSVWMTWKVESVDDQGKAKIASTIDRMAIKSDNPMAGSTEYDSASEGEPQGNEKMLSDMLKPIIGAKMTNSMSARGEVTDLQIPTEALEGMKNSPQGASLVKNIEQIASSVAPSFPEKVSSGDQWENQTEKDLGPIKMVINSKYTYDGTVMVDNRELHRLTVDYQLEMGETPGLQIEISEQKGTGHLYFDNTAGQIVSSNMDQSTVLKMSMAGQKVTQKIDQNVKVKFEKAQ